MFDNVTINTSDSMFEQTDFEDYPFSPDYNVGHGCCSNYNFNNIEITAKVKKKYEGLFKEIKVALEMVRKLEYGCMSSCNSFKMHLEVLNSIDLTNNCINYSKLVNKLLYERCVPEEDLINAINRTEMSGKIREKLKSVINCHESTDRLENNMWDIMGHIESINVSERKDAMFLSVSVWLNDSNEDRYIDAGLLLETFCEKVMDVSIDSFGDEVKTYKTEEGKWNNKLIVDYIVEDKKKQLVIPLVDLNKIYNIKLKAVFKEGIQKYMGAVLEVFKFALSKKDVSTDVRLGETIRTFSMNYDIVLYHTLDVIYDSYPVDLEDFNADDMADINKILTSKGYGKLPTTDEYYNELMFKLDFDGNIEYVSEGLSEKQWDLEINVRGDMITKLINSFKKMRHNTTELSCVVDGEEVLQ